jgi:hypothetical protein
MARRRSFAETATCGTRMHCVPCRSTSPQGEAWRKSMGEFYEIPPVCPHGMPVDTASPPPRPQGAGGSRSAGAAEQSRPAIAPEPRPWPLAVRLMASQREAGEIGVGDTLHRLMGDSAESFEAWFVAATGRKCGCGDRRQWLNWMYPYAGE